MSDDTSDPKPQRMKKSETLEVRLPHETKQAFLTACREDGTTASEVVRGSIDDYLDARVRPTSQPETGKLLHMIPRPIRKKRYLVAGAGMLGLAAVFALPSAAGPDMKAAFDRLDVNHDGILSADEFAGPKPKDDGDHTVIIERRVDRDGKVKTETVRPAQGGQSDPKIIEKAYSFWLGDDVAPEKGVDGAKDVVMIRREVRVDGAGSDPGAAPDVKLLTEDVHKTEFDRFDANHDGKVSYDEYEAVQKQMLTNGFSLLDENHDNQLTFKEYQKIGSPTVIAEKTGDGKAGKDIEIRRSPLMDEKRLKARFEKLDKDHNGKLSLQEYLP